MPQKDKAKLVLKEVVTKEGKRGKYWVNPNKDEPKLRIKKQQPEPVQKPTQEEDTLKGLSDALRKKVSRKQEGKGVKLHLSKDDIQQVLDKGMYAIISADSNPNIEDHKMLKKEYWRKKRKELVEDIQKAGLMWMPCIGRYGSVERSFLIFSPEMTKQEVYDLGKKYQQDSVVWGKGGQNELIYTTGENRGKANKGNSFEWKGKSDEMWTEFLDNEGKPQRFSINFDFSRTEKVSDLKKAQEDVSIVKAQDKVAKVLSEFKSGTLKDSHGNKITDRKQAVAIAMSEAGMSKATMSDEDFIKEHKKLIKILEHGTKKQREMEAQEQKQELSDIQKAFQELKGVEDVFEKSKQSEQLQKSSEENEIEKGGRKDTGKLVKKQVVDKTGKTTSVWVKPNEAEPSKKKKGDEGEGEDDIEKTVDYFNKHASNNKVTAKTATDVIKQAASFGTKKVLVKYVPTWDSLKEMSPNIAAKFEKEGKDKNFKISKVVEFDVIGEASDIAKLVGNKDVESIVYKKSGK